MRHILISALAGLAIWIGWATPTRAEVVVRVPFVSLWVGTPGCYGVRGVHVHAPFVDVRVGKTRPVLLRPTATRKKNPFKREESPLEPVRVENRPQTVDEFARTFKPAPGSYEVPLIHPVTKAAVNVRFTLPEGTPKKVRVRRRELFFNYGRHWVRIRFVAGGDVRVMSR
jgi:hypothetical protein